MLPYNFMREIQLEVEETKKIGEKISLALKRGMVLIAFLGTLAIIAVYSFFTIRDHNMFKLARESAQKQYEMTLIRNNFCMDTVIYQEIPAGLEKLDRIPEIPTE